MKRSLGTNCYLLSLSPNNVARNESPFRSEDVRELIDVHFPNTRISVDSKVGLYLTDEDLHRIKKLTKEIVQGTIIPFMDRSIQFWNDQVSCIVSYIKIIYINSYFKIIF